MNDRDLVVTKEHMSPSCTNTTPPIRHHHPHPQSARQQHHVHSTTPESGRSSNSGGSNWAPTPSPVSSNSSASSYGVPSPLTLAFSSPSPEVPVHPLQRRPDYSHSGNRLDSICESLRVTAPDEFQRNDSACDSPIVEDFKRRNVGQNEFEEVNLLRREASDEELSQGKFPKVEKDMSIANNRASLIRWAIFGVALAAVVWYFALNPYIRSVTSHTQAAQFEDVSAASSFDVADALEKYRMLESDTTVDDRALIAKSSRSTNHPSAPAAAVNMSHSMIVSGKPCSTCTFSFRRPAPQSHNASFFITGVPNHGAGVGHQFTEWVTGVWLAWKLNATYVNTNLLLQSNRWNTFLGLAEGELTVEDLYTTYGGVAKLIQGTYPKSDDPNVIKAWHPLNWASDTMESVRADPQIKSLAFDANALTLPQKSLSPGIPFPILLETRWVTIPQHTVVCEPDIYRTIRQKYCVARMRNPVREDLYKVDRAANKIVITWHLRCGDECFSLYRATSFQSIIFTSFKLQRLFAKIEPTRQLSFHFFSQAPLNGTAEDHFAPLMKKLEPLETHTHWHTKSPSVLHHLITSDVLFGAMSGFSWLAFLHHNGVSLGTIPSCVDPIMYDKYTGEFNEEQFIANWIKFKDHVPKFRTFQDCLDMK